MPAPRTVTTTSGLPIRTTTANEPSGPAPRTAAATVGPERRRARRWLTVLVTVVAVLVAGAATTTTAAAQTAPAPVAYRYPVNGPIVDTYRPTGVPGQSTNVGVDLAAPPGTPVGAPADGTVAFAGPVGAGKHVVVRHADGIRTSMSFLAEVTVREGQSVKAGERVGVAGGAVHFGARVGDRYIDPRTLIEPAGSTARVRLVSPAGPALAPPREGAILAEHLRAAGVTPERVGRNGRVSQGLRDGLDVLVRYAAASAAVSLPGVLPSLSVVVGVAAARRDNRVCTPAGSPVAAKPGAGRVLVTVRGFGSDNVSFGSQRPMLSDDLGYDPGDVFAFSYVGFTTEDPARPAALPYRAEDTWTGVAGPGRRLAAYLKAVAAARPGRPIDVVGHSLGGTVAQYALVADPDAARAVSTLTTLGSPHQGTEIATMLAMLGFTLPGRAANPYIRANLELDGANPTVTDLQPLSPHQLWMRTKQVPGPTRTLAVSGRWDGVVPNLRSRVPGSRAVTVDAPNRGLDGLSPLGLQRADVDQWISRVAGGDPNVAKAIANSSAVRTAEAISGLFGIHFDLTSDEVVRREILRHLAGQAPTCRSTPDIVGDAAASGLLQYVYLRLGRVMRDVGAGLPANQDRRE